MIRVKFSGDFALFSRPEAKVERASYSVPTPSAVRNMIDAICWKPEMRWVVSAISVLKPIQFTNFRRNEVQSRISPGTLRKWMADPATFEPIRAGAGADTEGTPRGSLLLRDVAYVIEARALVFEKSGDNTPQKYEAMLTRRVEKGQCHTQPVFGCREFPAQFEPAGADDTPIAVEEDLGRMLYDIVFRPEGNRPLFFDARLERGRMDTRPEVVLKDAAEREEVLRCSYRR